MRTNTRYLYTIVTGVIGIWSVKHMYYFFTQRKELDMLFKDFAVVGGLCGIFITMLVFRIDFKMLFLGGACGFFYGAFYGTMMRFFVNKRKKKAEKIGIYL